jgi:hypothetical protein
MQLFTVILFGGGNQHYGGVQIFVSFWFDSRN